MAAGGAGRPSARELQRTSSLNAFLVCDLCGKRAPRRREMAEHLRACAAGRTCALCRVEFKNRGNLFSHMRHRHATNESSPAKPRASPYSCPVCPKAYTQGTNLKFHIRREHYNMAARAAPAELRAVHDVWLERVRNTDALIEIRKAKLNMLLMKKADKNATLPIPRTPLQEPVDLSPLYPTHVRSKDAYCVQCSCTYPRSEAAQHQHPLACGRCARTFHRPALLTQHRCRPAS